MRTELSCSLALEKIRLNYIMMDNFAEIRQIYDIMYQL